MRNDTKEICRTCRFAQDVGELLTHRNGLFACPKMALATRDSAGSEVIMHVLVNGDAVGCMDDYEKDEMRFLAEWHFELAEERAMEGQTMEQIYGLVPGVDFPATL